jgi:hypothetical protein
VLEVVDADTQKPVMGLSQKLLPPFGRRSDPRLLPGRVIHAVHRRLFPFLISLAERTQERVVLAALDSGCGFRLGVLSSAG